MMRGVSRLLQLSLVIAMLALAACSKDPSPAPTSGSGPADTITGRERVGWDQAADDAAQAGAFGYAIYVDGVRSVLSSVSCAPGAAAQSFTCTGKGPDLLPGHHTLEIAAFTPDAESPRSSPLAVTVAGAASTAPADWPATMIAQTADGVSLRVDKVVDGLIDPVDAAFLPDGRLLIAERRGRMRIVEDGHLQAPAALSTTVGDDDEDGVLSIAIDPDFERTHFVFAVLTARTGSGDAFLVTRYRELRGTLAERAVLLEAEGPPVTGAAAALRIGPDGKLYLAIGAPGFPGTLLRLNRDGTMPRDQWGTRPAIAQGLQSPRGLALDPGTGIAWLADDQDGEAHLSAVVMEGRPLRAAVRARYPLPGGSGSLAFYSRSAIPGFDHTLLVASASGRHIERIRLSEVRPDRIDGSDMLLQDAVGPIDLVVVGPDGAIYFCAGSTLGRITAEERSR